MNGRQENLTSTELVRRLFLAVMIGVASGLGTFAADRMLFG